MIVMKQKEKMKEKRKEVDQVLPSEPGNLANIFGAAGSADCHHGDELFKLAFSLLWAFSSLHGDLLQKLKCVIAATVMANLHC
jgi:hypothetical protein